MKSEEQEINVGEAFLHRIKRLYPAYISLVLFFSLALLVHTKCISLEPLWYIFSLQNFRVLFENATYTHDGFLGHFWYIGLDVWLFLIWVVIMRIVPPKHLRTAFILSVVAGLVWRTSFILIGSYSTSYMIPVGQLDCWALGGLAALNIKEKGKKDCRMWIEIVLGLCGIIALTVYNASISNCSFSDSCQLWHISDGYMHNVFTGNVHFLIALLSVGLLRYCVDTSRRHPVLSAAPLVALGGMTYELYCFHYPIRYAVKHFIQNEVLMVTVALVVTIIVALLWNKLAMPVVKRVLK